MINGHCVQIIPWTGYTKTIFKRAKVNLNQGAYTVMPSLKGLKPGDYRRLFPGDKSPGISPGGKVAGRGALGYISLGISLQR